MNTEAIMDDFKKIIRKGEVMRAIQRQYFKTKDKVLLQVAMKAGEEFDELTATLRAKYNMNWKSG